MTANFKRFVRNMILTVALLAIAAMNIGCTGGDALDSDADKGAATWVWQCVIDTDPNTCSWK